MTRMRERWKGIFGAGGRSAQEKENTLTAELIAVGTELLLGNIVNTNAAYLARQCASLGLACYYQSVVGDNAARLRNAIAAALKRSDIVILSGGLGPTSDDLTKETAAALMKMPLVMDSRSLERIRRFFENRGLEMTENKRKQALVPQGALVLDNDNGTAPGLILEREGKRVILLPGPPGELCPMFEKSVRPYLSQLCPGIIYSRTVKICGMGESKVASMIQELIDAQSNPTVAPYAKTGEVHLRVTARARDEEEAAGLVGPVVKELEERFRDRVYTTDSDVTLEEAVLHILRENGWKLSTAESCTGGLLGGRLTAAAGASEVYRGGFITYSNKAKRKFLGVDKETLQRFGAVSQETALEMALGAAQRAKTEVSVSVTGIAGPGGGTDEKPVGLVYIGCCVKGHAAAREYRFDGNRAIVRESAVSAALTLVRQCVLERLALERDEVSG